MQTMMEEHSRLPDTSYLETPLLSDFFDSKERQSKLDYVIDLIKKKFPRVDLKN